MATAEVGSDLAAKFASRRLNSSCRGSAVGGWQGQLPAGLTDDHTEGQLTAPVPAQPVQGQGHPAAASADSQGKGQVLGMVPVQEPDADSSHQASNEGVVSNDAKAEASHPSLPPQHSGTVQGRDAAEAGGSVATAAPAKAETGGSNLHQGTAGSPAGVPAQSAALASGHSSTPEAAQAAAAISSALETALHNASCHAAEPHASPAGSTGAVPAPAGAQAQGEAPAGGHAVAAAAQAQGAPALAATAAESAANAVYGVAPQVAHGQETGLAEAAAHAAQAFAAQLAPIEGVRTGIDPAAAVAPHAMQAEAGAADPAPPPPPPPMLPIDALQASAAQANVGAPNADPAAAPAASKPPAVQAHHLTADCTAAAGTLPTAADALMAPAAVPGGDAHPIAAAIVQEQSPAPIAQTASASKSWCPKLGQALTVTVVLPTLVALHVPVGCWAASVVGVAACRKVLSAWQ